MPTIAQLIKKPRKKALKKSKSPALQFTLNQLRNTNVKINCPQKRGVCVCFVSPMFGH